MGGFAEKWHRKMRNHCNYDTDSHQKRSGFQSHKGVSARFPSGLKICNANLMHNCVLWMRFRSHGPMGLFGGFVATRKPRNGVCHWPLAVSNTVKSFIEFCTF